MKKLVKIRKLIIEYLKTKKRRDWIEPGSYKYTRILKEYNIKLRQHWQNTAKEYLKKIKTKNLDLIVEQEDYEEIEFRSTPYIDGALSILADAFGAGITIGYNEIISRGKQIKIPDNVNTLLNEAEEIKNYAHAALTNEQNQMDDIFNRYNNKEHAEQQIEEWFNNNEYRLVDMVLGGLVWYGINFGFTRAALEITEDDRNFFWLTEKDKRVCDDCLKMEADNPYNIRNPLHTLPGGGKTICGSSCRCIIDTKERD